MHSVARLDTVDVLRHRRAELARQVETIDEDIYVLDRMASGDGVEDPVAKALRLAVHAERIARIARADAEARAADEGNSTERNLLCALLFTEAEEARAVTASLRPDDITGPRNRAVFVAVRALAAAGVDPTAAAVSEELTRTGRMEAAGGWAHVGTFVDLGASGRGEAQRYANSVREAALKREASSALDGPAKLADIAANLARSIPPPIADGEPAPSPVALEDFLLIDAPPRRYILSPWLQESSLSMIWAERGAGKSWLSAAIALAVAGGGEVFPADEPRPAWRCDDPRSVLFVDGEMTIRSQQDRLKSLARGQGIDTAGRLHVLAADLYRDGLPPLSRPEGRKLIESYAEPGGLVILDNLSALTGGIAENDSDEWEPMQAWFLSLRRRGIAVLQIHHAGKNGAQRGTSRREDALDVSIALTVADDESENGVSVNVRFSKARHLMGHARETFRADLRTEGSGNDEVAKWTVRGLRDEQNDIIRELHAAGKKMTEIAAVVGLDPSSVSRRIAKMRPGGRS